MHKNLAVLTIFLAVLSHSESTMSQNITSDAIVAANGSGTSVKTEEKKNVSPQDSAEAKRLYKEAVKYSRGGLSKQASQLYEKAVQLNPNYADAHYDLGYAYFEQGRWEDAIRSFENAIRIKPKDKKTRAGLDEARVLASRSTEPAQHSEEKIAAADPVSTRAWAESRSRNVKLPNVTASSIAPSALPSSAAPTSVTTTSVTTSSAAQPGVTPTTVKGSSVTPTGAAPTSVTTSSVAQPSVAPTNVAPTTVTPTNVKPTSVAPTNVKGSSVTPTGAAPTNAPPASVTTSSAAQPDVAPTNVKGSSITPTGAAPTNVAPTNVAPTNVAPTNVAPTSVKPTSVSASPTVRKGTLPDNSKSASAGEGDLTRVYHIGIGDVLDVRLGNEPAAQSTLFTVTPSGLLEHPILAAPMRVSGLTVEETRVRLESDLKRRAVNENPRVLVGVREYLSHAIIVSGLVKEPGTKLLRREAIPLYVVIADAQPAPEAGRATLIRHETGDVMVIDLSKPVEMNLLVRSGDVITVQATPKQFFYVGGEVKSPGEIQFRPGLTLTQAILTAGGLSRAAKNAHIARASDKGFLASTRYKLKDINTGKLEDPLIQPGDRITVEH